MLGFTLEEEEEKTSIRMIVDGDEKEVFRRDTKYQCVSLALQWIDHVLAHTHAHCNMMHPLCVHCITH